MENESNQKNFADRDDDLDIVNNPESFRDAVLYGTDWTVRTLLQQIEDGNIDLTPNFQRRDAWSQQNKCRFIESIALQLPIPQIVLAERKDQRGTFVVLDGKQRLLAIAQFMSDAPADHWLWDQSNSQTPLKLSGLKILTDLNGKTYKQIKEDIFFSKIKTQFDNHTIRSSLIRNWPNDDYLYEVFIRLNSGSARLSPQELRQAMKPGPFTAYLNEKSANSKNIQAILGLNKPDFRMRDVDLLLRLIAFQTRLHDYRGDLKHFLDDTHTIFNNEWDKRESSIANVVNKIETGIEFLSAHFGKPKLVGRRWRDGEFEPLINRAVLDVQIAAAIDPAVQRGVENNIINLLQIFKDTSEASEDFNQAISGTTKSISAINTRFMIWKDAIEKKLGSGITFPALP